MLAACIPYQKTCIIFGTSAFYILVMQQSCNKHRCTPCIGICHVDACTVLIRRMPPTCPPQVNHDATVKSFRSRSGSCTHTRVAFSVSAELQCGACIFACGNVHKNQHIAPPVAPPRPAALATFRTPDSLPIHQAGTTELCFSRSHLIKHAWPPAHHSSLHGRLSVRLLSTIQIALSSASPRSCRQVDSTHITAC
jgi:hypothetical protein